MDQKIAVLFMPDNIACTEEKTPLMLQPIMFCPVLTWMCAELCGRGIERLFIVSDVSAQERMKPYLPKEADVTFVDGAKHAEELLKLLEGETGEHSDRQRRGAAGGRVLRRRGVFRSGGRLLRRAARARRVCRVPQGL
ncbi:MAG: hypothetical protein ACLSHJ_00550 [Oscillospiraceae bacterium]